MTTGVTVKKTTWKELKATRLTPEKQARIRALALHDALEISLRELRERQELTQSEVAEAAGMDQSELSRVERRGDVKLSTLRKVVDALGAELEVSAIVDGERVRLNIG
jgi:predicted XRE-type DNA-binding protein